MVFSRRICRNTPIFPLAVPPSPNDIFQVWPSSVCLCPQWAIQSHHGKSWNSQRQLSLYTLPLGAVLRKHGLHFHCYADDTQHYLSMKPDKIVGVPKIEVRLKDVKALIANNFLLLNSDKTEVMLSIHNYILQPSTHYQLLNLKNAQLRPLTRLTHT